ncbi:inactive hydroxysteroid dehydrogenase-like protein 1-like protein [Leptotrombidium deliense]|uniref:Inactive hydroxysteroid dehydrogenase-like protein 1-like protein n=1 Tax=Leptotrombidium deliense TaxID=299467 RepID=A0A443S2J1_9ACAR|nr:inactive hydroxysteroid dehydrogenase-like protein 1-like protein [Leptotrombidium deliense]
MDLNTDDVSVYHNIRNELQEYANEIGILINNAGVLLDKPGRYLDLSEDEVMQNVRVNISALLMVTRAILPFMVNNKRGLIINMSSASAVKPLPYTGVYSASKKFVEFFGSALGYEYKNDNIHVLTLVPSYVSTKMVQFSKFLSKPSFIIPSAKTFVSSAISTIGHTEHTTGYWAHGIYWFCIQYFSPMFAYQFFASKFLTSQQPKVESSRV